MLFLAAAVAAHAQTPTVGGVTDAAGFKTPVAPGALVSIFGSSLAAGLAQADTIPLSPNLGNVAVTFNGVQAPLLFVSTGQVNAQLPWNVLSSGTAGTANVVVTNAGKLSTSFPVTVGPFSPGIFAINNMAVAINPDGTLAWPTGPGAHPAKAGDPGGLVILCTGLGAVNPPVANGNNANDGVLHTATTMPTVLLGGSMSAPVAFAGLSPQFVGVNQINIAVPANAPTGNAVSLQIQVGGMTSAAGVTIAIQ